MPEAQRLELCVLLETPDMMELQKRQPDAAAARAVQESFRWPMDKWWQVRCFLLPAAMRTTAGMQWCAWPCNIGSPAGAVVCYMPDAPGQDIPGCCGCGTK